MLTWVGSLRAASVNPQIAALAAATAPAGTTVNVYQGLGAGLGELPLYNEDIDNAADLPASARTLRGAVAEADAILVVTPEYNGSIPGGLKNAIDWLSRPYGQNALAAKPLAGASMGHYGGVWAHDEARKSFGIAGADVVDAPAFSLPIDALGGRKPAARMSSPCSPRLQARRGGQPSRLRWPQHLPRTDRLLLAKNREFYATFHRDNAFRENGDRKGRNIRRHS